MLTDQHNISVFECFLPFRGFFWHGVITFQHSHDFPLQCIPDTPPSAMMMFTLLNHELQVISHE